MIFTSSLAKYSQCLRDRKFPLWPIKTRRMPAWSGVSSSSRRRVDWQAIKCFKSPPCCSTRLGGLVKSSDLHLSTWEVRVLTTKNPSWPLAAAFRLKLLLRMLRIPVCNQPLPLQTAAPFHPWTGSSRSRCIYFSGSMQNKARVWHQTRKKQILRIYTLVKGYDVYLCINHLLKLGQTFCRIGWQTEKAGKTLSTVLLNYTS